MAITVEQLQDFDHEWKEGDRAKAKEMATALVEAEPDTFKKWEKKSIPQLVGEIDEARAAGDGVKRLLIDVYLLAKHPPQQIGGALHKAVK